MALKSRISNYTGRFGPALVSFENRERYTDACTTRMSYLEVLPKSGQKFKNVIYDLKIVFI